VSGGEWHDVEETVRIVRIPCRFGGSRPYFACPGVVKRLGVEFVSLIEAIGTTTPMSSFIFNIKAVLAELERSSISECTRAGLTGNESNRSRVECNASGTDLTINASGFACSPSRFPIGRISAARGSDPPVAAVATTRCRLGQHRRMQRDTSRQ